MSLEKTNQLEKLNQRVSVRLTDDEFKLVKGLSKKHNCSYAYVFRCLLKLMVDTENYKNQMEEENE